MPVELHLPVTQTAAGGHPLKIAPATCLIHFTLTVKTGPPRPARKSQ